MESIMQTLQQQEQQQEQQQQEQQQPYHPYRYQCRIKMFKLQGTDLYLIMVMRMSH